MPVFAETAIDCRDLTVRFITERRTVTALERVSFTVDRGGFLALLGPSGCGKSTLLRVIADLVPPTSGTVSVLGAKPEEARRQRALGFVFQDAALLPWRTALQNVELPLEVGGGAGGLPKGGPTPRELLKLVGLDGWEASFPHELSGGMRQRAISFVFQDAALLPWRTALQNVELPLEVGGGRASVPKGAPTPRELLRLVGLGGWETSYPDELSGGMRQRVSIARALVSSPRILLMDEPFGALDEITRDRLNEELRRIWQETQTTILFVTHFVYESIFLGEQVLVLAANPGRVKKVIGTDLPKTRDLSIRETEPFVRLAAALRQTLGSP